MPENREPTAEEKYFAYALPEKSTDANNNAVIAPSNGAQVQNLSRLENRSDFYRQGVDETQYKYSILNIHLSVY